MYTIRVSEAYLELGYFRARIELIGCKSVHKLRKLKEDAGFGLLLTLVLYGWVMTSFVLCLIGGGRRSRNNWDISSNLKSLC